MAGLIENIKEKLGLTRRRQIDEAEAAELRRAFQARYHNFRLLLAANNQALGAMSEMEGALRGTRPITSSFLRGKSTEVSVAALQMVRRLDELAPEKYLPLFDRFQDIQARMEAVLQNTPRPTGDRMVVFLEDVGITDSDEVGSKMANLGQAARLGLPVPPGFVLTTLAYHRFINETGLQEEINRRVVAAQAQSLDQLFALSSRLQQLIIGTPLPAVVQEALEGAYHRLEERAGKDVSVALRSSALGEDSEDTSFAGQYRSELNVSFDSLADAYREVVASKYSPEAISYRVARGISDQEVAMCVGCLAMVPAKCGGVIYTGNPLDKSDRRVHLNSTWGLPKGVVDGSAPNDVFIVERGDPPRLTERIVSLKEREYNCYPTEGVCRLEVTGDRAGAPSLEDTMALTLAGMALRLEEHYGRPLDVEFAVDRDDRPLILQCRPLGQISPAPAEDGPRPKVAEEPILTGGVTASPGAAAGPVHRVQRDRDALDFPEGAVLVTSLPRPRWAALLSRAKAVVTAEGGAAGHLATVAREAGIPALFGVGPDLESLADGAMVTVDAGGKAVYPGVVEALISAAPKREDLMAKGPLHRQLGRLLDHVSPLHLMDPDSQAFRADNCLTLHDITRFCHEKSVKEMFDFGKEHHFPRHSSKQLHYKVPMQWWVLDLDDGFTREINGKYVHMEEIASGPMLALWDGMLAIPWAGPPAMDRKGMASVMFQATANPALSNPMHQPYANKNYFMISKNFLSLQSRFGFHFSTVEALAGPREGENYISFSFKGGAADLNRRLARVDLVVDILEELGFRVRKNEDAVFARLEGLSREESLKRLKLLGYLIMHTRQLDMVMADPRAAAFYRGKLMKDMEGILAEEEEKAEAEAG